MGEIDCENIILAFLIILVLVFLVHNVCYSKSSKQEQPSAGNASNAGNAGAEHVAAAWNTSESANTLYAVRNPPAQGSYKPISAQDTLRYARGDPEAPLIRTDPFLKALGDSGHPVDAYDMS